MASSLYFTDDTCWLSDLGVNGLLALRYMLNTKLLPVAIGIRKKKEKTPT